MLLFRGGSSKVSQSLVKQEVFWSLKAERKGSTLWWFQCYPRFVTQQKKNLCSLGRHKTIVQIAQWPKTGFSAERPVVLKSDSFSSKAHERHCRSPTSISVRMRFQWYSSSTSEISFLWKISKVTELKIFRPIWKEGDSKSSWLVRDFWHPCHHTWCNNQDCPYSTDLLKTQRISTAGSVLKGRIWKYLEAGFDR